MEIKLLEGSNDLISFQPKIYGDSRGYFLERYNNNVLQTELRYPIHFVQQNESFSRLIRTL